MLMSGFHIDVEVEFLRTSRSDEYESHHRPTRRSRNPHRPQNTFSNSRQVTLGTNVSNGSERVNHELVGTKVATLEG